MLMVGDGVNDPVVVSVDASIANTAPELGAITAPIDPASLSVEKSISTPFTDQGALEKLRMDAKPYSR